MCTPDNEDALKSNEDNHDISIIKILADTYNNINMSLIYKYRSQLASYPLYQQHILVIHISA